MMGFGVEPGPDEQALDFRFMCQRKSCREEGDTVISFLGLNGSNSGLNLVCSSGIIRELIISTCHSSSWFWIY